MPSDNRSGIQWISRSRDLKSLRRIGSFFRGGLVFVWVFPNASPSDEEPFVGIVTGKGFRNAVKRNRARRRVRGCLMDSRQLLKPGGRYLVECRPGVDVADYQLLVIELQSILSRISNCETKNEKKTNGGS
jgi:ribonuclease P protein component